MFGLQWGLVLKYLETSNAATVAQLTENSGVIGNYCDGGYEITSSNAESSSDGTTWATIANGATTPNDTTTMLTTAASETFNLMGIYDLAGNVSEWILGSSGDDDYPCIYIGGDWNEYRSRGERDAC